MKWNELCDKIAERESKKYKIDKTIARYLISLGALEGTKHLFTNIKIDNKKVKI